MPVKFGVCRDKEFARELQLNDIIIARLYDTVDYGG